VTTWTRARVAQACGGCPRRIVVGEPMLERRLVGVRRVLVRCQACAGEAAPELPPLIAPAWPTFAPMVHIRTGLAALPLDFKHRASGED
jgi:hypothetical protein